MLFRLLDLSLSLSLTHTHTHVHSCRQISMSISTIAKRCNLEKTSKLTNWKKIPTEIKVAHPESDLTAETEKATEENNQKRREIRRLCYSFFHKDQICFRRTILGLLASLEMEMFQKRFETWVRYLKKIENRNCNLCKCLCKLVII